MSLQYFYLFVSNIPFWVFPLFAILLIIGLQARNERNMPVRLFWFLPLVGLVGLPGLMAIGRLEAFTVFALAYLLGVLFGKGSQQRIVKGFEGARVRMNGEWLTLTSMMVLFLANLVSRAVGEMAPELSGSLFFILPLVCVSAFCSGIFAGRSLGVIRLSRNVYHQVTTP